MNRPLTQAEIAARKKAQSPKEEYVTLANKSPIQTVNIQLKAPSGVPFTVGEQTIPLFPKASAKFPKSRLIPEQIENLQKTGLLRVSGS
jgi:hypothetical protein